MLTFTKFLELTRTQIALMEILNHVAFYQDQMATELSLKTTF